MKRLRTPPGFSPVVPVRWFLNSDEEGEFIRFLGAGDSDEAFTVYLPAEPTWRKEAIETILKALNEAGIIVPRRLSAGPPKEEP